MTTRTFWERKLFVFTAGLTITSPKIDITLERKVTGSPPSGEVIIYNLNKDTEQQIYEGGGPLAVVGGYGDNIGVLWRGKVTHVNRVWDAQTRATRIQLGGETVRPVAHTNRSWSPTVSTIDKILATGDVEGFKGPLITSIVRDLARDMGLELGRVNLSVTPRTPFQWTGSPPQGLTALLQPYGISWYEEDKAIHLTDGRTPPPRAAPTITLSPETGLVGLPEITEKGARVTSLLLSQVALQGTVRLLSRSLVGLWQIVALTHRGTNWPPGDFVTEMELRAV